MNMVIHDMRNPTSAIEFGVEESLRELQKHFDEFFKLREKILKIPEVPNESFSIALSSNSINSIQVNLSAHN
jgi:hypothetical protein